MRQDHLTEDQILALKNRSLTASQLLALDDHLSSCALCRDRAWKPLNADRMVASVRNELLSPSRSRSFWLAPGTWAAAAAILVSVLLGTEFYRRVPAPLPGPMATLAPANSQAPDLTTAVPPAYQALLDQAERDGRLERAPVLSKLIRKQGSLLAPGSAEQTYSVRSPLGTVVLTDRPLLQWQAVPNADHYTVSIFDTDYRKIVESPDLKRTEWQPKAALERGKVYSWQVSAVVNGETVRWPQPPAPEAVFQVLDSVAFEELNRTRLSWPDSHLLLGVLYAKEGLLDDARSELKLADPSAAKPLLKDLDRIRHQ